MHTLSQSLRGALAVFLTTVVLFAQEGNETAQDPAVEVPRATSIEEAQAIDRDALSEALEVASAEDIRTAIDTTWLPLLKDAEAAATRDGASESELAAAREGLDNVRSIVDEMVVSLEKKGGEPGEVRAVLDRIGERIAAAEQQESERSLTLAEGLATEPDVLAARLRPLELEEVETELGRWKELLKQKARELGNVEVASLEAEKAGNTDEVGRLNERVVELRAERDKLAKRYETVVSAFERKGGAEDAVKAYRAYADSTIPPVKVTGIRAAWVQARSWLLSVDGGIAVATNIVLFLVILIAFRILSRIVGRILGRTLGAMKKTSNLLRGFIINSVKKVIFFIGVVVALGQVGVDIGPFLAAIGAAGFVIGFALQGTLSNFASGVMIMIYRPYDVGDVVNMAGIVGIVDDMTLVSTTVKTFDNQLIVVPNSKIWGDVITNVTANDKRRVDMQFGIGYGDDIAKAEKILNDIVNAHPKVLKDPEPVIKLHELGDSSVNFIVRPWSLGSDYWGVYWDITKEVKQRFDAEGISIPFPQRDVHLFYENAPVTKG